MLLYRRHYRQSDSNKKHGGSNKKAEVIDFKVVEDHGNLGEMSDEEMASDAEDTLTILTKHIEGMEITGDKAKLENLVRSLYTEALDA